MNRKVVSITLLFVLFASCKTTRYNMRETAKTSVEVKTDVREEVKILEEVKISENITQLVDELTTIIERIITVKLSAPDSLHNQHPVEIITTEREISRGKTVKYDATGTTEQTISADIEKIENSTKNTNTEIEKVDKTKVKTTTPVWLYVVVGIFSIGILLFVFLILKKYKIL